MAGKKKASKPRKTGKRKTERWHIRPMALLRRWLFRAAFAALCAALLAVGLYRVFNPPTTHTIWAEARRLGEVDHQWVDIEEIAPVMLRSAVAAEDANFCLHWGFDMDALRAAIAEGARRGGSTISQQVVKNAYLWQARSYVRKALEALLTPLLEALWPKRRILEVYLNIAEFGEGIFGVEAAAQHYFRKPAKDLTPRQAALLASVLPSPKTRNPERPSAALDRRARAIQSGAALIKTDGRSSCFQD